MKIVLIAGFIVWLLIIRVLVELSDNIKEKVIKPFKIKNSILYLVVFAIIICALEIIGVFNDTLTDDLILAPIGALLWAFIVGIQK